MNYSVPFRICIVCSIAALFIACGRNSREGSRDRETNVRIINAVPDVPSLDFYLDNKLYLSDVRYLENSGYSKEDTGGDLIQINLSGTGNRLVDTSVGLSDGRDSTFLVFGRLSDPSFLSLSDDNDPASKNVGKIRFINTAYDYRTVDIYINEGSSTASIDDIPPSNNEVRYRQPSRYALLTEGTYSITVTLQDSKTPIATLSNVKIGGEGVYTVLVADGLPLFSGTSPKLVYLTDR